MTDSTNYFIAWWSAVYSRLAYLNPQQFLGRYTEIFGDTKGNINNGVAVGSNDGSGGALPTTSVLSMMQAQATGSSRIQGLLDDKVWLALQTAKTGDKRWGLNVISVHALNASAGPSTLTLDCITNYGSDGQAIDAFGEASAVASWAEKVNIILGERRKMDEKQKPDADKPEMVNCAPTLNLKHNPMLVFRAVSDSNYGTTYVFGDKRAPYLVWVVFRGTANAKSAGSYTRVSSLSASLLTDFFGIHDKGLKGIFKILQEQIHVIIQMAVDVANELNPKPPGDKIAPGSIKLLTTGHSLGGALATAFAGEYVQQISPNLTRLGAEIFDIDIGCYSLASPRIYGVDEAKAFCCLTQAINLCKTDSAAAGVVGPDSNVKGRISYLRIVTKKDPVPGLPKAGYDHPCSDFKEGERDMITMDCDANKFITNTTSTRCLNLTHKRPSMTANFGKGAAPECTDARRTEWGIIPNMLYHLTYCGIIFAGGVDMTSVLSSDVERLQKGDDSAAAVDPTALGIKADNTMMRILWYGFNNETIAKCVFFDLVPLRVNEVPAQGGGGMKQKGGLFGIFKPKAAPVPGAAPATPNKFLGMFKKTTPAATTPAATTPAATTPAATTPAAPAAAPAAATPAATTTDSSPLHEDSGITKTFITVLKNAIMADKYNYPITDSSFQPPILYRPLSKGGPQYDYLYPLPSNINVKMYDLFFGNKYDPKINVHDVDDAPPPPQQQPPQQQPPQQQPPQQQPPQQQPPQPSQQQQQPLQQQQQPQPQQQQPPQQQPPQQQQPQQSQINVGGRRTRRLHKLKSRKHKKGKKGARVSRRKHDKSRTKRH